MHDSDTPTIRRRYRIGVLFNTPYFAEYARHCVEGLSDCGYDAQPVTSFSPEPQCDAFLVIGIHLYPDVSFCANKAVVGIQTEQLPLSSSSDRQLRGNLKRFRAHRSFYDVVLDWNPSLYERGVGGQHFLPYACAVPKENPKNPEYDLLFIGNVAQSPRRREYLHYLRSLKNRFSLYPDFSPGFGERKRHAIHSSRICLNIHYYDGCGFEAPRMYDYLSHAAFVLSERSGSAFPFVVGRDFEEFRGKEELADKIQHFLDRPDERGRIARHGCDTARRFDHHVSSRICAWEIARVLQNRTSPKLRRIRWSCAAIRSKCFSLMDSASMMKRRLLECVTAKGTRSQPPAANLDAKLSREEEC